MSKENKKGLQYSNKSSLSQPLRIQKLFDGWSLGKAWRLSFFIYFGLFGFVLWKLLFSKLVVFPIGFRLIVEGFICYKSALFLSEIRIDDKSPFIYLKDMLSFIITFGLKGKSIYKGWIYPLRKRKEELKEK